jgi:hypothetical protein
MFNVIVGMLLMSCDVQGEDVVMFDKGRGFIWGEGYVWLYVIMVKGKGKIKVIPVLN